MECEHGSGCPEKATKTLTIRDFINEEMVDTSHMCSRHATELQKDSSNTITVNAIND